MHRIIQLPPIDHPKVARAADAYRKLGQEQQTLTRQRAKLDAERQQALRADREAYAAALRAGKDEPSKRAVTPVADRLEQIGRRIDAIDLALDGAFAELVEVARAHRGEWTKRAGADTATRRQAATDAVVAAGVALAAYSEAASREGFALEFPERTKLGGGETFVRGLTSPNGSPYAAGEVIAAVAAALAPSPAPDARTVLAAQPDPLIERVA